MKSNLDKHIDSKIKNSFESLQTKAPVHLWDNISEEMDMEHSLDETIDQKMEESYLSQANKTAPAFVWNAIADDLDADALLDNDLDSKLKESFEDPNALPKAPAFLWGAISEDLNHGESPLDAALDDKLKESFTAAEELPKTPNTVWVAINRQLNIDKTWLRISKVLDKKPVASLWRTKVLPFFAAASLLLLFAKTCEFTPQVLENETGTPALVEYVEEQNKTNSNSNTTNKNSNQATNNSGFDNENNKLANNEAEKIAGNQSLVAWS
jgi:hypothetical protein